MIAAWKRGNPPSSLISAWKHAIESEESNENKPSICAVHKFIIINTYILNVSHYFLHIIDGQTRLLRDCFEYLCSNLERFYNLNRLPVQQYNVWTFIRWAAMMRLRFIQNEGMTMNSRDFTWSLIITLRCTEKDGDTTLVCRRTRWAAMKRLRFLQNESMTVNNLDFTWSLIIT